MQILIALCAIIGVSIAGVVITAQSPTDLHPLGQEECAWGPSYWCENIKTAAGCNATKHCIKTVWTDMKVPEDNDNVCVICKDMVQQARDQLESNQTQNDLKTVFEGSCKLIHIKVIVNDCIKIVDQFIPDLVETLASQMNPSVVCSVAGLCNSAHIDKLLEKTTIKVDGIKTLRNDELEPDECTKCYTVAAHMQYKLNNTPHDKMLQQMLNFCVELNTFTDACSATILTYFDIIYAHLQESFNAQNICHLSGQCSAKFHKHINADETPKVEIRPLSSIGMVDVSDDLPCKLCEQLVGHLRDLLVANTTEAEFLQVLDGLCKQTKSFSSECTAIVEEYYSEIYEYLTKGLNSNAVCQMSGICPAPDKEMQKEPIWPLVPNNVAEIGVRIFQDSKKNLESGKHEESSKEEVEAMQLPIERMIPFPISEAPHNVQGKTLCALCEYVLHYIQDSITNPVTEDKVKHAIEKVCKKLPESIRGECSEIIDIYGDAIVAILAQEIDPSQVCPMLHFCPTQQLMDIWQSIPAQYILEEQRNKPSCPLCLLAVSQIYNVIKDNKTEANIESVLDKLCIHLPRSLSEECTDLVKGYSKELVELLLADMTPEEVCVFLKLCDDAKNTGSRNVFITDKSGEILTNEIPDISPSSDMWEENDEGTTCVVCEYAMRFVDKELGSEKGRDKVESAVHGVCNHLSKKLSQPCNNLITKYGDAIINAITKNVSPKQVCSFMRLCSAYVQQEFKVNNEEPNTSVSSKIWEENAEDTTCVVCEYAMRFIDKELGSEKGRDKVKSSVHGVCNHLSKTLSHSCNNFITKYGDAIINAITESVSPKQVCSVIGLCALYIQEEFEVIDKIPDISPSSDIWEENDEGTTCVVCEYAMRFVDNELGSEKGRNKVQSSVHGVCNHLPKTFSQACNTFITKYGDAIINVITKDVSPKQVCSFMGLCTLYIQEEFKGTSMSSVILGENEVGPTCVVCEYAMRFIDKELGGDKGKNKVESTVRSVCKHLPKTLSRPCKKFVNKHGDNIINAITKDVSPKQVCRVIGLCTLFLKEEFKVSVVECAACKEVISVIAELLRNPKGDDTMKKIVSKACKYMPASKQSKCVAMINVYGQSIINLIEQHIDSKNICSKIGLCASEDYSTVSLESSRIKRSYEKDRIKHCTWGPIYWCSTNETALECKAVEHCKENVWKADFAPPKQITLSVTERNV